MIAYRKPALWIGLALACAALFGGILDRRPTTSSDFAAQVPVGKGEAVYLDAQQQAALDAELASAEID